MQLAFHDLLVCKYLTLYIRVLLFIMCFNFFHHAPPGNQFVLKELACLNKVLPTYLPLVKTVKKEAKTSFHKHYTHENVQLVNKCNNSNRITLYALKDFVILCGRITHNE